MSPKVLQIVVVTLALAGSLFAASTSLNDLTILHTEWFAITSATNLGAYHGLNECEPEARSREPVQERTERCDLPTRYGGAPAPRTDRWELKFVYTIKVMNTGPREIAAVHWEYDFLDRRTGELLYRHAFRSESQIGPGEVSVLRRRSLMPPTPVIPAHAIDIDDQDLYAERVRVTRIEYADEQGGRSPE